MKTYGLIVLLSTLAAGSTIPRSLIPLPSVINSTPAITATGSFIPLPTVLHPRPTASPSNSTDSNYHRMVDLLRASGGESGADKKREESGSIEKRKKESCWDRVDGWCAIYCDDMYPGPDKGAKRQACTICIAVQSAFCLA